MTVGGDPVAPGALGPGAGAEVGEGRVRRKPRRRVAARQAAADAARAAEAAAEFGAAAEPEVGAAAEPETRAAPAVPPAPAWVPGARLGVDVGKVRVGVAVCDPDGILATPLTTLRRDQTTQRNRMSEDIAALARLVEEYRAVEVVVGLPVNLAGQEGIAAGDIRRYVRLLARAIGSVPVRLADERMSTVVASRRLSERGVRGRRQRAVIDQAAAVEILQGWLDTHRRRT